MESEMLSGIAQKAERTVEWKKQSVISTGISRETPCTRDPVYAGPCVRETPCYYSEGPRL